MAYPFINRLLLGSLVLLAAGCGGGGDGDGIDVPAVAAPPPPTPVAISGAGVKGPLIDAEVRAYVLDPAAADLKGELLDTGTTGADAAIVDLEIDPSAGELILLEFVAAGTTTDLTTGMPPILETLITVVPVTALDSEESVYASPLTSMVVLLAQQKADGPVPYAGDGDSVISLAEFERALEVAATQVASTFGFGLIEGPDIFSTPPLLTGDTTDPAQQQAVAAYRAAIEAFTTVVQAIVDSALEADPVSGLVPDDLIGLLARDLADGVVDGAEDGEPQSELAGVDDLAVILSRDPNELLIPNTDIPLSAIPSVLADETFDTGNTGVDTSALEDGSIVITASPPRRVPDTDQDGVADDRDNCPLAANADQRNTDGDAQGNVCDPDDDNDGFADESDLFPLDETEWLDSDGDGVGNNGDTDDDNDGVADAGDNCVFVPNPDQADADGDGVGDACETSSQGSWNNFNWNEAEWN